MKISINSRDLGYTIDTYGMFNGENSEENEREFYKDEYGLEKVEFNYNHEGIVKDLAHSSINLLSQSLTGIVEGVVKSIDLGTSGSPQFYNYTTDHYTATWTINSKLLKKYIQDHKEAYEAFEREEWSDLFYSDPSKEDKLVAMLDFYTRAIYAPEDYEESMFECEYDAYSNNMSLDEESEKKLNKAIKENKHND